MLTNLPNYSTILTVHCGGRTCMAYGAPITAKARKSLRKALDAGSDVVQVGNRIEWAGPTGAKWALVLAEPSRAAAIATVESEFGLDWKRWGNGPGQHRYTPSIIDGASCADPWAMRAALAVLGIPYWDGTRIYGEFAAA